MLVIRAAQMEAFREEKRRELARWLRDYLRGAAASAVEGLDDEQLFDESLDGIHRAEQYGLTGTDVVVRFVTTLFLRGRRFDAHPAIRALLTDASIPPALRMDAVFAGITESQWKEARALGAG